MQVSESVQQRLAGAEVWGPVLQQPEKEQLWAVWQQERVLVWECQQGQSQPFRSEDLAELEWLEQQVLERQQQVEALVLLAWVAFLAQRLQQEWELCRVSVLAELVLEEQLEWV